MNCVILFADMCNNAEHVTKFEWFVVCPKLTLYNVAPHIPGSVFTVIWQPSCNHTTRVIVLPYQCFTVG